MFKGSIVAMVTPFDKNDEINKSEVADLIEFHKENGTNGLLIIGCTGESFTLTDEERKDLIEISRTETPEDMPLIVGTGAPSTKLAVERTKIARDMGADAALVITPFGNKPSEKAKIDYYSRINEVGIPIILYNVPSRTGTDMKAETVIKLSELDNIVAIKEASGSLDKVSKILNGCDITVLSGDDSLTLPMLTLGAQGVVSTTANIVPADMANMVQSFLHGDVKRARDLHYKMFELIQALFIEGNPVPLKNALKMTGIIEGNIRAPLGGLKQENKKVLRSVLQDYGLL